jgi:hypothetical protein
VTDIPHVFSLVTDLGVLDARIADLTLAAKLATLPPTLLDHARLDTLKVCSNRKDRAYAAARRTCPDTGSSLLVSLWHETGPGRPLSVELEMADAATGRFLHLVEPPRIHGPSPDLGDGDAPWLAHIRDLLAGHRDRMAIPEERRPRTSFADFYRMLEIATHSAQRGGVLDVMATPRRAAMRPEEIVIELAPPSPYGRGSLVARDRLAAKGMGDARRILQPAVAIRSDLARHAPLVNIAMRSSGLVDVIELGPYGRLNSPIRADDRDPMRRLRDAADFAIDRVDLNAGRHVTTIAPSVAGRLVVRLEGDLDGDLEPDLVRHVADVLRTGADAAPRSHIDPVSAGSVMFRDPVSGITYLRRRSLTTTICFVEWIIANAPLPNQSITLEIGLAGCDHGGSKETITPDDAAAELSHLAAGLEAAVPLSASPPADMEAQVAITRIASILDVVRSHDRDMRPYETCLAIDAFGNVDASMTPVFSSNSIPIAADPQDLGDWIAPRAGYGILKRLMGSGLRLQMRAPYVTARYVPDDPRRTDVMERLRTEAELLAGLLPVLHDSLLDNMA